jgi:DNA polymerase I-like protein with 3'-5' exonuclease and polymerase domains/uracil-DNA glycosylase
MIVGEAPSAKASEQRLPITSTALWLLSETLKEAGLFYEMAFSTNVARETPPESFDPKVPKGVLQWMAQTVKGRTLAHKEINGRWVLPQLAFGIALLRQEVLACRPTVVIAMGDVALWSFTGKWGIRKWRSSILQGEVDGFKFKVIPVNPPDAILREWPLRGALVNDFRRVKRELARGGIVTPPDHRFIIRPNYQQARVILEDLLRRLRGAARPIPLAADIETRAGHTACIGIAWSRRDAICIPWMCVERHEGYWSHEEETQLIFLWNAILTHPMASITWQNGAYDHQYEHRWHFIQPNLGWDTMVAHHAMFSISPKGLDYLSSLYCDNHVYWKEDGKLWDPSIPEEEFWYYNCEDCVRTFEIREEEESAIAAMTPDWPKLPSVVKFQHDVQPAIVRMMLRGVRSDDVSRAKMGAELMVACNRIQTEIDTIVGQPLNTSSPKQMTEFFYDTLHQTPIYKRLPNGKRGNPTCDDDALLTIASREPVLRPLVARIQALRSGRVFNSTFVQMSRDVDGRLRCSYNVAGTKTYRLASSENAFGSGGNLQNVPSGDEDDLDALLLLPNIRKLFLFDHGRTGFDLDGDSADLRIVTGESGCRAMQAYFAAGVKPYVEIAKEFYRDPTITKHHKSYKRMKALCHGTNYGGEAPGLAERIGLPVHDISKMQTWYFGMCPEIRAYQEDIKNQVANRGWIENPFGQRLWIWDRVSRKIINEALAWIPQSTVGRWINTILLGIDQNIPLAELLLQVHDSLVGQIVSHMFEPTKREILDLASKIIIPCRYEQVIVPAGMKTSTTNWGECE